MKKKKQTGKKVTAVKGRISKKASLKKRRVKLDDLLATEEQINAFLQNLKELLKQKKIELPLYFGSRVMGAWQYAMKNNALMAYNVIGLLPEEYVVETLVEQMQGDKKFAQYALKVAETIEPLLVPPDQYEVQVTALAFQNKLPRV